MGKRGNVSPNPDMALPAVMPDEPARGSTMWKAVLVALLLGVLAGAVLHEYVPEQNRAAVADYLSIATDLFLRMIKMIIGPLVFASLVSGIAHMGDMNALGQTAMRTLVWFLGASIVSLGLGALLVNILEPGVGLGLAVPELSSTVERAEAPSVREFVIHLVPQSVFDALARNEILQIVVFSIVFGIGLAVAGPPAAPLVRGVEMLMTVMLHVTTFVMKAAPVAVFAAVANAILVNGLAILATLGAFVGSFYFALIILWTILLVAGFILVGSRLVQLVREMRSPFLIAFSAASSEAAFPQTLDGLTRFGVPRRIASFVLPLGYSFNLDGSMMYCTFAVIFIAQAYGIELSFFDQLTMLLLLLVTSKGMAAVPRASLVVIAATLAHFDLPEAGLLLIMAVDQFLDMGRSATNVIGNAVATVAVARWDDSYKKCAEAPAQTIDTFKRPSE